MGLSFKQFNDGGTLLNDVKNIKDNIPQSLTEKQIEEVIEAYKPEFNGMSITNDLKRLIYFFRKSNTSYSIGDITYSKNLPSYLRLECIKSGITGTVEPDFSQISGSGDIIIDGSILWIVDDIRDGAQVGDIKFSPILKSGYVKANGGILINASINYPRLINYIQNNPLLVATFETIYTHNKNFYYYDSTNDILKLPNYKTDVPIGTIISCIRNTVPENYLICDGTVYNITDYEDLAEFIKNQFSSYNYFGGDGTTTFAVPDLRGEFLRGSGTNSHANQGSGSNVGLHQDGTWLPNVLSEAGVQIRVNTNSTNASNRVSNQDGALFVNNGQYFTIVNATTMNDSSPLPYKITTRPTNTSVLYCIKYTSPLIPQIKY